MRTIYFETHKFLITFGTPVCDEFGTARATESMGNDMLDQLHDLVTWLSIEGILSLRNAVFVVDRFAVPLRVHREFWKQVLAFSYRLTQLNHHLKLHLWIAVSLRRNESWYSYTPEYAISRHNQAHIAIRMTESVASLDECLAAMRNWRVQGSHNWSKHGWIHIIARWKRILEGDMQAASIWPILPCDNPQALIAAYPRVGEESAIARERSLQEHRERKRRGPDTSAGTKYDGKKLYTKTWPFPPDYFPIRTITDPLVYYMQRSWLHEVNDSFIWRRATGTMSNITEFN